MSGSQHLEWKQSWRDEYLRWVCGFANAEGGMLVIGRDDAGAMVGVADAQHLLEELPNKVRDLLGIMVDVNLRRKAGRAYLEIVVPAYPNPISYRGEYYYRSGSTNQTLKGAALDRFLLRKQGRHWDGVPVPQVTARALSKTTIDLFRKQARLSQRLDPAVLREATPGLLEKLHLLEGKYLKRAAVLLFHPDPERFVTGAFVKIGFFRTNADLLYHDEIHGDLFTQVERTIDLLRTKYLRAAIRYEGIQRIETFPVPGAALREAVLNAVIHKDYARGAPIQISVYDNKLMLWNPGELPQHWTIAKLKGKHASHPFNPDIANAFFRAGQIEAWGRGIERIVEACREAGTPAPDLRYESTGLWLEFRFPKTATTVGTTPELAGEVAGEVERLLRACKGAMTRRALREALRLEGDDNFRRLYLLPALAAGLLEMTLPDKPNSRLQKYRLTAAGRRLTAARQAKDKA